MARIDGEPVAAIQGLRAPVLVGHFQAQRFQTARAALPRQKLQRRAAESFAAPFLGDKEFVQQSKPAAELQAETDGQQQVSGRLARCFQQPQRAQRRIIDHFLQERSCIVLFENQVLVEV